MNDKFDIGDLVILCPSHVCAQVLFELRPNSDFCLFKKENVGIVIDMISHDGGSPWLWIKVFFSDGVGWTSFHPFKKI